MSDDTLECSVCRETKPDHDFAIDRQRPSRRNRRANCKECSRVALRAKYLRDKEIARELAEREKIPWSPYTPWPSKCNTDAGKDFDRVVSPGGHPRSACVSPDAIGRVGRAHRNRSESSFGRS